MSGIGFSEKDKRRGKTRAHRFAAKAARELARLARQGVPSRKGRDAQFVVMLPHSTKLDEPLIARRKGVVEREKIAKGKLLPPAAVIAKRNRVERQATWWDE